MHEHWPEYMTAIGTVGAFAVGGVILARELQAGRRRDDRDREQAEAQRRAQASRVVMWPGGEEIPDPVRAPHNRIYRSIVVHNASELPIYRIFVGWSETIAVETTMGSLDVMPAGDQRAWAFPNDPPANLLDVIWVQFTDAAGVPWWRTGRGQLIEHASILGTGDVQGSPQGSIDAWRKHGMHHKIP